MPFYTLFGFLMFILSLFISRYCNVLVYSMSRWSVLKLPSDLAPDILQEKQRIEKEKKEITFWMSCVLDYVLSLSVFTNNVTSSNGK